MDFRRRDYGICRDQPLLSGPLVGWLNLLSIPLMIIVVVFVMERMRI